MTLLSLRDLRLFGAFALILTLGLAGCPGSDDDDDSADDDDDSVANDDDSVGDDDDSVANDDDSVADDDDSVGDPFVFRDDMPSAFTRVDRIGMPAIATAVIASKDAYNAGDPAGDLAGFAGEVIASVDYVHFGTGNKGEFPGIAATVQSLGLTTCGPSATDAAIGTCIDQALSVNALPDTLTIDLNGDAGFPNGRDLDDPVIDLTLAVLLLDLSVHPVTTFIDLDGDGTPLEAGDTLNPAANDATFSAAFPYLAPAW